MIKVNCQECGKEFEAKRTSAKFCSANCRVKFNSRIQYPKEAQQEPETEKVVESTQNEIEAAKTQENEQIDGTRVILNSRPEKPIEFFGNFKESTGITSFKGEVMPIKINLKEADANSKFDQLLKQFNSLVDLTDKPKDIKLKLEQIKETAKNSNLTPRQTDSIIDRVNFYLNNQYGKAKHSLILG